MHIIIYVLYMCKYVYCIYIIIYTRYNYGIAFCASNISFRVRPRRRVDAFLLRDVTAVGLVQRQVRQGSATLFSWDLSIIMSGS